MEKLLTVAVPSYNVSRFLNQTLSSFIEPSIMDELEVLAINDGSRDNTEEIAKKYEAEYPQTFRVVSKENGGYGSTFNVGIAEAKGRYFRIVDGDDWVNTEGFAELVRKLRTCDADYVVTDFCEVDDETKISFPVTFPMLAEKELWSFNEAAQKTQLSIHELTIKTSILKEHNITVDEPYYYIDVEFILFPVPHIETVAYFKLFVLMYRVGQLTQSVSLNGFQKHIDDHAAVLLRLVEFWEKYRREPDADPIKIAYIHRRIAQMLGATISIFRSFPADNLEMKRKFIEFGNALREKSK